MQNMRNIQEMQAEAEGLLNRALSEIEGARSDLEALNGVRVKYLGKSGEMTALLKETGRLSKEDRPIMGKAANEAREKIETALSEAKKAANNELKANRLKTEGLDITVPGKRPGIGSKHPITQVTDELSRIFLGMGFELLEGPDIETEYYNFEALNIPKNHPARDEQDTFYIEEGIVLRTQTSPVQIRTMERRRPPIKIIAPGRVFRADEIDATHSPVFHQLEGLFVDKNVTMANLKAVLEFFARELFGKSTKTRFRPHHFPFTEPSAEMDVTCFYCGGEGCRICKQSGFIELLGCGMVHPVVLENCGINPAEFSGFAFGMGLERIAMQRYGITDIRLLYENDVSFLKQF